MATRQRHTWKAAGPVQLRGQRLGREPQEAGVVEDIAVGQRKACKACVEPLQA